MFDLLSVYALILVTVVFVVVSLSQRVVLDHRRTQLVMSFVSGILLGIAVFHLLPHAINGIDSVSDPKVNVDFVARWLMVGLVGMFLLQRLFHFHQHDFDEEFNSSTDEHAHQHSHQHAQSSISSGSDIGVFTGLALHSMIDGLALAAAIYADQHGGAEHAGLAGAGVFLAILLHKPLDAITIDMFAKQRNIGAKARKLIVLAYALLCPVVATLVMLGIASLGSAQTTYIIGALAFSAGMFLCIALSDLLPEIHFHQHDRFKMTLALLVGIAISQGVTHIESHASHHLELSGDSHSGAAHQDEHRHESHHEGREKENYHQESQQHSH